jgi:hypothetical protein
MIRLNGPGREKFVSYALIEVIAVGGVPSPRICIESGINVTRGGGTPPTAMGVWEGGRLFVFGLKTARPIVPRLIYAGTRC